MCNSFEKIFEVIIMGGGIIQIASYGAQDVFLTGNPQITFFKMIYRRHTNFAIETIRHSFEGTADFDKTVVCSVPRNGDLAYRMYVRVKLSSAGRGLCDLRRLLKSVELEIGGQRIDKQYYHWQAAWHYLTYQTYQKKSLKVMTETTGDSNDYYYLPLDFWFCRNPGLSLPLIALQYHEVKIRVELEESAKIYDNGAGRSGSTNNSICINNADSAASIESLELMIDYVFLDADERRRFSQTPHEYLIEQVQHTGIEPIEISDNKTTQSINLRYNHPVKELVWCLSTENGYFNQTFGGAVANTTTNNVYFDSAKLILNGQDRFKEETGDYFSIVQPFQHHTGIDATLRGSNFTKSRLSTNTIILKENC